MLFDLRLRGHPIYRQFIPRVINLKVTGIECSEIRRNVGQPPSHIVGTRFELRSMNHELGVEAYPKRRPTRKKAERHDRLQSLGLPQIQFGCRTYTRQRFARKCITNRSPSKSPEAGEDQAFIDALMERDG